MALFGSSTTVTDLHREIGYINDYLRKMESEITRNGGIDYRNIETIANYFMKVAALQQKAQDLINRLSDRELNNLTLCWMDGRYLLPDLWNASYLLIMNQVKDAIEKY
jgi:hypothetical protein